MFYLPATSASQQTNIPSGQSIVSTYSQGSFSPQSNRGILEAPCSSFPPLTSQPYFVSPYATNMPFIPPSFTNMPFIPLSSHPTYKTYQNDHSSSLEDTSEYGCDSSPSDNNVTSSPGTGTCQTDHSHDNHTLISQSPPLATCTSSGITSSETTNDQVFREAPLSQEKEVRLTTNWSRQDRVRRKLALSDTDPNQCKITSYFEVVDQVSRLISENQMLTNLLFTSQNRDTDTLSINSSTTTLLSKLLTNIDKNTNKSPSS